MAEDGQSGNGVAQQQNEQKDEQVELPCFQLSLCGVKLFDIFCFISPPVVWLLMERRKRG